MTKSQNKTSANNTVLQKFIAKAKLSGLTGKAAIEEGKRRYLQSRSTVNPNVVNNNNGNIQNKYVNDLLVMRKDGNIDSPVINTEFMEDGRYNMLYAAIGNSDWPVPLPNTSQTLPPSPFASCVNRFAGSNVIHAMDRVEYVAICPTPNGFRPVWIDSQNKNGSFNVDLPRDALSPAPPNPTYARPIWTGFGDMRSRMTGMELNVIPTPPQTIPYQQFMGGEIEVTISVPWSSMVDITVIEPTRSPEWVGAKCFSELGSKMDVGKLEIFYDMFMPDAGYRYYWYGKDPWEKADTLFNKGGFVDTLTGASNVSTIQYNMRVSPGLQGWMPYLYSWLRDQRQRPESMKVGFAPLNSGMTSGNSIMLLRVPIGSTCTLNVKGWYSYNMSLNGLTPVA